MRLILWDIDGTLLYSGGVAGEAMRAAMTRVYGRPASNDRREYAGKTDQQIQAEDDDGVDRHADGDVVVIVVGQHQRQGQKDRGQHQQRRMSLQNAHWTTLPPAPCPRQGVTVVRRCAAPYSWLRPLGTAWRWALIPAP